MSDASLLFLYLQNFWQWLLVFVPSLVGALVVFLIGWAVASIVAKIISEILVRIGFNKIFDKTGWNEAFAKAELKINPAEFIGGIVKLTLIIVFLMPAVEILHLSEFAIFLKGVIAYLPNVFVAAFILAVAVMIADVVEKIVVASVEKAKVGYSGFAGAIVRWAIWVFAILAILNQLGIAKFLVETLFTGLVGVLVLSFGLAFGLGGKDVAAELLQDLKRKLGKK